MRHTAKSKKRGEILLPFYLIIPESTSEKELFETLYDQNRKTMYKVAEQILSQNQAEDGVHNAFLRIAKHISKFTHLPSDQQRYLCITIVKNVSRNMLRDAHKDQMISLENCDCLPDETDTLDEILRVERLSDITKCIKALTPALREVVNLRLVLECNTAETAALLGVSAEVVKTRLHRGRMQLKEMLSRGGITLG